MSKVRLFVGVDLPPSLIESIAVVRKELSPHTASLRWVRPESIHLTLKFLGSVDSDRILVIDAALKEVRATAFKVLVSGVGFFPNLRAPRLFWVGVKSESLETLVNKIDKRMVAAGFHAENRKFTPHLTLARGRSKGSIPREAVQAAKQFWSVDFGSFTVKYICLYESLLDGSGAIYNKLHSYVLDTVGGKSAMP